MLRSLKQFYIASRLDTAAVGVPDGAGLASGGSMRLGLWIRIALILLVGLAVPAAAQPQNQPARPQPARIVAVGDLHGNHRAFRAIVRAAGLIDARGRWAGGQTVLVQTGDVVDRGPDSLKIIRDLMRLQREAKAAGGGVVALVGNHEAMNVTGDLRYVHPGEYAAFADRNSARRRERTFELNKAALESFYRQSGLDPAAARAAWMKETPLGKLEHRAAWAPEGEIGRWIIANPVVAIVGGTLFVHGGISARYAAMPAHEINRRVAAALIARETGRESILNEADGPLWYRGLAEGAGAEALAAVLQGQGVERVVIGHTPVLAGIALLHEGRLARIDTGISAHYGGAWSYLEIRDGKATAHVVPKLEAGS